VSVALWLAGVDVVASIEALYPCFGYVRTIELQFSADMRKLTLNVRNHLVLDLELSVLMQGTQAGGGGMDASS
jgi:hypothetical protein